MSDYNNPTIDIMIVARKITDLQLLSLKRTVKFLNQVRLFIIDVKRQKKNGMTICESLTIKEFIKRNKKYITSKKTARAALLDLYLTIGVDEQNKELTK